MKKRVFISSTGFDLVDLRAELASALKDWGYIPIWNESPDFPKKRGLHSHDICLDAVKECDIYVLIIHKRYGGTYVGTKYPAEDISITWYETKIALQENKEIHVFVRDQVWTERLTYKKNVEEGIPIKPQHVDNPKVFEFIDFIVHQYRDNWIDTFKDSVELKEKLRIMLKITDRTPLYPCLNNMTPLEPNFVGRKEIIEIITKWYKNPEIRIGAFIGWGGVGKSALVRKWYDNLEKMGIRPDGIFWWGFYRNAYLDSFLDSLLGYLAQDGIDLTKIKSSWQKVDNIKELILKGEYLIILDGLEEMQKGIESGEEFGCMAHRECCEILRFLADTKGKGLCLITTRYPITEIKNYEGSTYQKLEIERLDLEDARALFERVGVKGCPEEIDKVIEEYKGHALSLTLLSRYLVQNFYGDIKKAKEIPPFYADREAGGKAHRILCWYAEQLTEAQLEFMTIFSLFRTSVFERDYKGVFREKTTEMNKVLIAMSEFSFKRMVDNLCDRRLISKGQDNSYSTHPLIKNYFQSIFKEDDEKLCHKRIYEFIGTYAPERPETVEEMQPLFEQIYHGCAVGLYDEVYNDIFWGKINRRDNYYIIQRLGAWETTISLVRNFFPKGDLCQLPLVSKKHDQGLLLNITGVALLNTGKPKEGVEPLTRSCEIEIDLQNWKNVSTHYRNLAELQFRIGEFERALLSAKEAEYAAEKTNSDEEIVFSEAYLAWILYILGKTKEASEKFCHSDALTEKARGHRSWGLRGVFYADFLLSINESSEAFELSNQNLAICENNNLPTQISQCHRCLAAIERKKGNYQEAELHLRKAIEIARKIGIPFLEIETWLEWGRLHLDMGMQEEAISDGNWVLKLCGRTGFKFYEPQAEVILGKAHLSKKDKDLQKAEDYATSAYQKATAMKYLWGEGDNTHLLGEIYLAKGDKENARTWLEEAATCRKGISDPNAKESERLLKSL